MNRKIMVIIIVVIAGVSIYLSFSVKGIQNHISVLTNDNAELRDENAELQDGLTTIPFVQIGRNFLDGLNKTTGKILSIQLKEKTPNFYWHNNAEMDKARAAETGEILPPYVLGEFRLCWVLKFEQANCLGHYFGVWIDANTSQIIGMDECL